MSLRAVWTTLFTKSPKKTFVQVFRYFLVSSAALVVDFVLLAALTELLGLHHLVSAAISYTAGLVLSYFISVSWVFETRRVENRSVEFGVFAIIGIAGLGINELTIWVLADLVGIHYLAARIISAGIGYVWKYVARRLILFR